MIPVFLIFILQRPSQHIFGELNGRRNLKVRDLQQQVDLGINDDRDGEISNGTAADFLEPCYPLPDGRQERLDAGWVTAEFCDDGTNINKLNFPFTMYGNTHEYVQVDANGALTFGPIDFAVPFFALDFPNPMMDMVAPYWSDVDVRPNLNLGGSIWWKDFGDHFAVVWDDVGFANGGNGKTV